VRADYEDGVPVVMLPNPSYVASVALALDRLGMRVDRECHLLAAWLPSRVLAPCRHR